MPIAILFSPGKSMTRDQYQQILGKLVEAKAFPPAGQLTHCCYGPDQALKVFDIFEDPASFEAFGRILLPILLEVGVDVGEPDVQPNHNHFALELVAARS